MKLDYEFLKQILFTLENYKSYKIALADLRKEMNLDKDQSDKLEGHIKLLDDNKYVEFEVIEHNKSINSPSFLRFMPTKNCRLTSQGYEFLGILQNDTILNKIKNLALPTAFELGKQLLMQILIGSIQ